MVKKKKNKIKSKKSKSGKRSKKKIVKKLPENIFGQQIEIQQEVAPVIEIKESEPEIEIQREIIKNISTEPEEEKQEEILESISITPEIEYEENISPQKDLSQGQKIGLMYIAIGSIMCAIIFFWLFSVKNTLGQGFKNQGQDEDLSVIINEIKDGVSNFSNIIENQKNELKNFTDETNNIIIQEQIKNEVTNKMKEQIQNSNLNLNTNQ